MRKLLKPLLFSGSGLLCIGLTLWVSGTVVAKKQSEKMDAIATQFIQQYPDLEKNESARRLETLALELGLPSLSGEDRDDSDVPDPVISEAWQAIRVEINDYLRAQEEKEQGPLDPLPETVQTFINNNLETLDQVQTHLRSQPQPQWDLDVNKFTDIEYPIPSFFGLREMHSLILLKAVHHAQQSQPEQMVAALNSTQHLTALHSTRPDLLSYLISLIEARSTIAIVRHLADVPPAFSAQLTENNYQDRAVESLHFDNWTMYKGLMSAVQSSDQSADYYFEQSKGAAMLFVLPFYRSYMTLSLVNMADLRDKSHNNLTEMNHCTAVIADEDALLYDRIPWWNDLAKISISSFARQWQKGSDRALEAELTHHIVQAKALAAEQGAWPVTLPNLASQVCPGEEWKYETTSAGEMSLSFSYTFPKIADDLPQNQPLLTYRAVYPE